MSWHTVRIPVTEHSAETAFKIDHVCEQRKIESGSPQGFLIFPRKEYDDGPNLAYIVYYFSRVSYSACADLLVAYNPLPCDAPM